MMTKWTNLNSKLICFLLLFIALEETNSSNILYSSDFEKKSDRKTWDTRHTEVKKRPDNYELQVHYEPFHKGSHRVQRRIKLEEKVTSATLNYDVKFHSEFEFVKGGKLHGLSGGKSTTGCDAIHPNGWSARVTWTEGTPKIYVYHQDRQNRCGDIWRPNNFKFELGRWYTVSLYVSMNSAPDVPDGTVELFVDGVKLVSAENLRLSGREHIQIDHFLFSTFHGGSNDSWSPTKRRYAYFNNFFVLKGKRIADKSVALRRLASGRLNHNEKFVIAGREHNALTSYAPKRGVKYNGLQELGNLYNYLGETDSACVLTGRNEDCMALDNPHATNRSIIFTNGDHEFHILNNTSPQLRKNGSLNGTKYRFK